MPWLGVNLLWMKMLFTKRGFKTGAFHGDEYRSEYTFTTVSNLPVGKMIYADFRAVVRFDDRTLAIRPADTNHDGEYTIFEEGSIVGHIKSGRIELLSSGVFSFKSNSQSFWQSLLSPTQITTLANAEDEIHYSITKGVRYKWGYSIRESSGEIEVSLNGYHSLSIAFLGMFLFSESEHYRD